MTDGERSGGIQLTVNGESRTLQVPAMKRLLDVLREDLHLTGTKEGCGEGECGACAVLLNGELVNSCLVPALQASGTVICTIEGVSSAGSSLHPIQHCFLERGGAQCGICTPGMILATHHLLERHPHPSLQQIQEGLSGNLCRCTGYMRIFDAVEQAALQSTEPDGGPAIGQTSGGSTSQTDKQTSRDSQPRVSAGEPGDAL